MLSNTLVTNEVKNAAGTELEFQRLSITGNSTVFAYTSEAPATPHRLTISHQEIGSGIKKRRRSVVRFDKTSISTVDTVTPVTTSAYLVLDNPIGAVTANTEANLILANIMSFVASLGANTTILYDGTGNGAVSLLNGSI